MSVLSRATQSIAYSLIILSLAALPVFAGKLFVWQSLLAAALVFTAAIILLLGSLKAGPLPTPSLVDVTLVLFLGLSLLSMAQSVYLHDSLLAVGQLASYLLIFWLCRALGRHEKWRCGAIGAVVAGGIVAAIWGLREYAWTVAAAGEVTWRIFGPFYNPNLLAGYLLLVLPLVAAMLWCRQQATGPGHRLEAVVGAFALVLLAAALLLTGSKGGLLAAVPVVSVLAMVLPAPGSGAARKMRWLASGGLVLGIALALALPPIKARLLAAFTTESHSTAFRYLTWRGTLSMIGARPLLGFGPGSFQYVYPRFAAAGFTRMAHQSFLQIAAETGTVSLGAVLIVFAALAGALVRRLRTASSPNRALVAATTAALVGFLVHNLVDYSWYAPAVALTMWALLGLAASDCPGRLQMARPRVALAIAVRLVILAALIVALAGAVSGLVAQSRARKASALARRGFYLAATQQIKGALRFDPLDAELWEDLANYEAAQAPLVRRAALVAAIRTRLQVAQLRPTEATNYRHLAELYVQAGDLPSAIAAARRAVREHPAYVEGWVTVGEIYELSGSPEQAEVSYRQVAEIYRGPVYKYAPTKEYAQPTYAHAFYFLAGRAADRGQTEHEYLHLGTAAQILTQYLRQVPLRQQMLELVGGWNEAEYERLRNLSAAVAERLAVSGKASALMRAGELYLALDKPQKAEEALNELSAGAAEGQKLSAGEKLFTGRGGVSLAGLLAEQGDATGAERTLGQGLSLLEEGLAQLAGGQEVTAWEDDDTQIAQYMLIYHRLPPPKGRMALVREGTP